jgi:N-acetylmuramoyl-L-alanine amidase
MKELILKSQTNNSKLITHSLSLIILALFLSGCGTITSTEVGKTSCNLFELPPELESSVINDSVVLVYTPALTGKKFYLDPGHGGSDRKNKSPNGIVIEADINLFVSLYLKGFLERAGATVNMTRETDKTVELNERTNMANNSDAEYFISVHHNAPGKASDRFTNYTSTYYHAEEKDYEHHPSNRDLARYINRDLAFNTGRPAGLASFDGTISDYLIYPGDGFSVLRNINLPAVLVECSFFTNLNEELRLSDTLYNKMEAWGIFKGLAKYFKTSPPALSLKEKKIKKGKLELIVELNSKQPILPYSIKVFNNKELLPATLVSFEKNLLIINLEDSYKRETEIKIIVTNKVGLSNLPFILILTPEVN